MNKDTKTNFLLEEAKKLSRDVFSVIPLREKIPIIKWTPWRNKIPTDREIEKWFSDGRANGIAIVLNNSLFALDTDGDGESLFLTKIRPRLQNNTLKDKIKTTMHTKTPRNGHHRLFRVREDDFPKGIPGRKFLNLNLVPSSKSNSDGDGSSNDDDPHNGIEIIGSSSIIVERGTGYRIINDADCILTLSKEDAQELFNTLEYFRSKANCSMTVLAVLKKHYHEPNRNNIAYTLSGFLHKANVSRDLICETIEQLALDNDDKERSKRLDVVRNTCKKKGDSAEVTGRQELLRALRGDEDAIIEIEIAFGRLCPDSKFRNRTKYDSGFKGEDSEVDDLAGIDPWIRKEIASHIYVKIVDDPPTFILAREDIKVIQKVVVDFVDQTKAAYDGTGRMQTTKKSVQVLRSKYRYIRVFTTSVTINKSPFEEIRKYTVKFKDKSSKEFVIGPCTIPSMVEELYNRGKVIKKLDAADALTAILDKYEQSGLAEVTESVTTQGYYYFSGKFEYHNITQFIDKEPDSKDVKKCCEFLDELSTKWRNEDIFPTVIKWFTIAPFAYIIKDNRSRWLKGVHEFGHSSSAKTTFGVLGLAIWRLQTNKLKKEFQLSFSNIDTIARFGNTVSNSTYPKLVEEVGALSDKIYSWLVEAIKNAISGLHVRGKYVGEKYQNIPALCNLFLTGNPQPPSDSGYRSRNNIMHFSKEDVHERTSEEAKEFEKWLNSKLGNLGVLGDFITRYCIIKPSRPEDSILFSDKELDEMAVEIITEFYNSVDKDKPEWLDRTFKQRSITEENTEQAYFEIRKFFIDFINNSFSRHYRPSREEKSSNSIVLLDRINFLLDHNLIPFFHKHVNKRKDNTEEMLISHDVLSELKKSVGNIEGITTLEDLGKEIPGFEYVQREVGGKNRRVLTGGYWDFVTFVSN